MLLPRRVPTDSTPTPQTTSMAPLVPGVAGDLHLLALRALVTCRILHHQAGSRLAKDSHLAQAVLVRGATNPSLPALVARLAQRVLRTRVDRRVLVLMGSRHRLVPGLRANNPPPRRKHPQPNPSLWLSRRANQPTLRPLQWNRSRLQRRSRRLLQT